MCIAKEGLQSVTVYPVKCIYLVDLLDNMTNECSNKLNVHCVPKVTKTSCTVLYLYLFFMMLFFGSKV